MPLIVAAILLSGCGSGDLETGNAARKLDSSSNEQVSAPLVDAPASVPAKGETPPKLGACRVQDGAEIPANRFRAVGTEPFWGARIEGRCVIYSHPDDQAGTRVWTRWSGKEGASVWEGMLGGKPFILRMRAQPGCSDGMSDERYPMAVSLTVGGEERQGCAVPL
jgi:uncharacterized membrane protein